jgi:hypothetical protein
MSAKKRSSSEKDLEKTVRKLRAQLERSDAKVKRWKKKAVQSDKAASASQARVKKLERRLDKAAERDAKPTAVPATGPTADPASGPTAEPASGPTAEPLEPQQPEAVEGPDASWTVVQLRAEARSRGLTGLSNKSKAQLLEALG